MKWDVIYKFAYFVCSLQDWLKRRNMKKWITIVLSVCIGTAALATEKCLFGRELPPPAKIEKVLSAGNPADVLLLSSAPNKLLGLAGFNMEKTRKTVSCSTAIFTNLRENSSEKAARSRQRKLWHYNRI